MYEIKVLPLNYSSKINIVININFTYRKINILKKSNKYKGKYLDLNQELTMPHTATLPIELHLPKIYIYLK